MVNTKPWKEKDLYLNTNQRDDLAVQFYDRISASDDSDALLGLKPLAHITCDVLSEQGSAQHPTSTTHN